MFLKKILGKPVASPRKWVCSDTKVKGCFGLMGRDTHKQHRKTWVFAVVCDTGILITVEFGNLPKTLTVDPASH